MPTSRSAHPSSADPSKRPATINELAEQALEGLWDDSKELKHYLRVAEKYRREGKESLDRGDLEPAFIAFARAATLVLEKLPNHRDYKAVLNAGQRQNLSLVRITSCDTSLSSEHTPEVMSSFPCALLPLCHSTQRFLAADLWFV